MERKHPAEVRRARMEREVMRARRFGAVWEGVWEGVDCGERLGERLFRSERSGRGFVCMMIGV